MTTPPEPSLSIGQVSSRTGLSIATLRAWEARHGFPSPERLAGGHRRYTVSDADAVIRVLDLRSAGSTMADALARREPVVRPAAHSLFAELRRISPRLPTTPMRASTLLALSHAIEDEYLARAQHGFIFGGFQTEQNFDRARSRWLELARVARAALAFADFAGPGTPAQPAPTEVALAADSPMRREWALVCDAPDLSVALIGWEVPGPAGPAEPDDRAYETIWTLDPEAVRHLSRLCVTVAASAGYAGASGLTAELAPPPPAVLQEVPAGAITLMNRFITYLEDGSSAHAPEAVG